jgi:hypothetical protein
VLHRVLVLGFFALALLNFLAFGSWLVLMPVLWDAGAEDEPEDDDDYAGEGEALEHHLRHREEGEDEQDEEG